MSSTMSYQSLKMSSLVKDAEEKRLAHREKAMLIFTFQLLLEKGYMDTATSLSKECSLALEDFSICDNIDLRSVFLEFETYYHIRYQRYPLYYKKCGPLTPTEALLEKMKANPNVCGGAVNQRIGVIKDKKYQKNLGNGAQSYSEREGSKLTAVKQAMALSLNVTTLSQHIPTEPISDESDEKMLKPVSGFPFPNEDMRMFGEMIQKEIVMKNLNTKWEDVIGLEDAKRTLKEALIYAKDFVEFFGQGLTPWKGLLLYGPPGVGKTLLAKAVATECGTTFFNISSASIVSKWRGDSEKIVKVLFDLARYHAPSTIFFDEFDALGSKRDTPGESDASRRLKSGILQQMDGILSSTNQETVFILAATNLPWELDPAILRRLEKRIYAPLPSLRERSEILRLNFEKTAQSVYKNSQGKNILKFHIEFDLAHKTIGYSGSDLSQIVKETVVRKFRQHYGQQHKIRQLIIQTEDVLDVISSIPPTVKSCLIQKFSCWDSTNHQSE